MSMAKIEKFEDIEAWQKSRELTRDIYAASNTGLFAKDYGLHDQIQRAAVSIDWEAAKARVLSVLQQRAQRNEPGLTNTEIRGITHFDRAQVKRLMAELVKENVTCLDGRGRGATWSLKEGRS